MGISVSLLLAAAGAALIWAVNATVSGMNIHTIGVILLIVGVVGFATSLFFWSSWGGFSTRGRTAAGGTTTTVTRDRVVEQ
jgi:ABC-type phosphate transport system auxiliary subunit